MDYRHSQEKDFEKAFKDVAGEMYQRAIKKHRRLEGYSVCGIDLSKPEGLVKVAMSINSSD